MWTCGRVCGASALGLGCVVRAGGSWANGRVGRVSGPVPGHDGHCSGRLGKGKRAAGTQMRGSGLGGGSWEALGEVAATGRAGA